MFESYQDVIYKGRMEPVSYDEQKVFNHKVNKTRQNKIIMKMKNVVKGY